MFASLATFIYLRRRGTLIVSALFLALSIAMVVRGGNLTGASFGDNEAEQAQRVVDHVVGRTIATTVVAVFHSDTEDPRNAPFQAAMKAALAPLVGDPDVESVMTADEAPPPLAPGMVNGKAKSAVAMISLKGDFKEALARYPGVRARLRSSQLTITCTGNVPFMDDFNRVLEHDLVRAELVSLPLALLVLLLVFRTAVAAALPVGVGALAVVGGVAVVLGVSHVTEIAAYAINVCSLIGLGVAIDYSLFTVSRYREELAAGHDYPDALARALGRAGPVVTFSGLAVATGLVGLLFFRGSMLWGMGVAGMAVVLFAVVFALTFLPALLAVLGPRIHAWPLRLPRLGFREGFWHRAARWVMLRPVAILVPTLACLTLIASPFVRLTLTSADVRVLGPEVEARHGYELLLRDFPEEGDNRVVVAVRFPSQPTLTPERIGALFDLSQRLGALPHVRKVESLVGSAVPGIELGKDDYQAILMEPPALYREQIESAKKMTVGDGVVVLYALTDSAPETEASESVVKALRASRAVLDGTLSVGGQTAANMDATAFIEERTPRAIGFVVAMTLVILFFLLGSVILPIKAIVMNFVSVASSFGALVWVFQEGHLGLADPRPIEHGLPVLLFCVLFGLSMDYEVLMLSRIKETYMQTKDNTGAVAEGLEKTAGLITSAAAIMIVVFAAFTLAKIVLIRAVGFGMAFAVAIDATLVRLLLVPATMRLFGKWNWWAPAPLVRLRARLGLH